MERGREGRRGSGGHVPAPRRPRTSGFKDSSAGDDDEMIDESHIRLRLKREALKREHAAGSAVGSSTSSRYKRKRQEMQIQAQSSTMDEMDASSNETDAGVSEEDDETPPPIPRWPAKPKPPQNNNNNKVVEDGILADLPVVPRKLRSAFLKRPQETHSVGSSPRHSPAPASSNPVPAAVPTSSSASKPGRRTKPNGSKHRAPKIPASISDQEVEVAEALFDLARMLPVQVQSVSSEETAQLRNEAKADHKVASSNSVSASANAISGANGTVGASIPAPNGTPPEAPKRKRPRIKPRPEGPVSLHVRVSASAALSNSPSRGIAEPTNQAVNVDKPLAETELNGIKAATVADSSIAPLAGQVQQSQSSELQSDKQNNVLDAKPTEVVSSLMPGIKDEQESELLNVGNCSSKHEKRKRQPSPTQTSVPKPLSPLPSSSPPRETRPNKFDIDLMAPPGPLTTDTAEAIGPDVYERQFVEAKPSLVEKILLEKEQEKGLIQEAKECVTRAPHGELEPESMKTSRMAIKDEEDIKFLDLSKEAVLSKAVKGVQKADKSVSAAVVSAASSFLASASLASNGTSGGSTNPFPATSAPLMFGGVSPLGYYGPTAAVAAAAAAAWSQSTVMSTGGITEEKPTMTQLTTIALPDRQKRKNCATHVYIAHFIEVQQQLAQHSLFSPYGSSSSLYGAKRYNSNVALGAADSVYGNNSASGTMGTNVSETSAANSMGGRNIFGVLGDKTFELAGATAASFKERTMEAFLKKPPPQQAQLGQQPSLSLQTGTFSFSEAQPSSNPSSNFVGNTSSNLGSNTAILGGVNLSSGGLPTVVSSTSGASNANSAPVAAGQVQYYGTFPFTFPHFGYNGAASYHQAAAAAQMLSNSLYPSHLQHTMQTPQSQCQPATSSSMGSSHKQQQQQQQQVSRLFPSGSVQQHQAFPYGQQQQNSTGAPVSAHAEKDSFGGECALADNTFSLSKRNMYSQHPNAFVQSLNTQSGLSADVQALQLHTQDFSFMTGKHASKHQQQSSGQAQHQQSLVPAQLAGGSLSFKGLDPQVSQANSTSGSVMRHGQGPLGLASVANVLAPQGHAMLQTLNESARAQSHHQQAQQHYASSQGNAQFIQQGQQQQRAKHAQFSSDESRSLIDSSNGREREAVENRNLQAKRGLSLSRVDLEPMQGSPSSSNSASRLGSAAALNLLPAATGATARNMHPSSSTQSINQNGKQTAVRNKTGSNLSFLSQGGIPGNQGARQGQAPQITQLKAPQKVGTTVSASAAQTVLSSSIAKNQYQQTKSPQNTNGAQRLPAVTSLAPVSSTVMPLSQVAKQNSSVPSRNLNSNKSPYSTSQKAGAASVKKSITPGQLVTSSTQNSSEKTQQLSSSVASGQQQPAATPHQHSQQHSHLNQQQLSQLQKQLSPQLQIQPQLFLQQPSTYVQQHRTPSQLNAQQLMQAQQAFHRAQQPAQQSSSSSSQGQQQQQQQQQFSNASVAANGGLSLGPTGLALGMLGNGNTSIASRSSTVDEASSNQGAITKSSSTTGTRPVGGSSISIAGNAPQKSSTANSPVHSHHGSSGRHSNTSQANPTSFNYLASSASPMRTPEQKAPDALSQDHVNGACSLQSSPSPKHPSNHARSNAAPRSQVFGTSSNKPAAQSLGSNYSDGIARNVSGTQSSVLLSSSNSGPISSSHNGAGSGSNGFGSVSEGKAMFGTTANTGQGNLSPPHPASSHQSSLTMVAGPALSSVASSGTPSLLGQTSSSVLQP